MVSVLDLMTLCLDVVSVEDFAKSGLTPYVLTPFIHALRTPPQVPFPTPPPTAHSPTAPLLPPDPEHIDRQERSGR